MGHGSEEGWRNTSGAYGKPAKFRGKTSHNSNKGIVVDHRDPHTMTWWRSKRFLDHTGLSTFPAPFPPGVPAEAAGTDQWRGAAAGLGCVCNVAWKLLCWSNVGKSGNNSVG